MKNKKIDYRDKFKSFTELKIFNKLDAVDRDFITTIAFDLHLTFQEFRYMVEAARDLQMWGENRIGNTWLQLELDEYTDKKTVLDMFKSYVQDLKGSAKHYIPVTEKSGNQKVNIHVDDSKPNVYGICPVASQKTVCCNLRTIDAVETCVYGCSYCTIQTFYNKDIFFTANLEQKLDLIKLDKDRYYHYGSGQSSDALAWGNKEGILDAQCNFARKNPNVLMEFKTKSKNIRYFLENETPPNIVCSWSLNPQIVIDNEEHFTAGLEERIEAAYRITQNGGKVSFHFHPMIYYDAWKKDYRNIAEMLLKRFNPDNILFVSYGSVTLIKPVLKKIREAGNPTKITQMQLVPDPHGKLTYPDNLKIRMFRSIHENFKPWHGKVFFYLCMEKAAIWQGTFGFAYDTNELFEAELLKSSFSKIN